MKRYIPLLLIAIFFCLSLAVKQDLMFRSNQMSDEERATNYCLQFVTISPITIIGGLILGVFPKICLRWADSLFGTEMVKMSVFQIVILRIFGIGMLITSIRSLSNECAVFFLS